MRDGGGERDLELDGSGLREEGGGEKEVGEGEGGGERKGVGYGRGILEDVVRAELKIERRDGGGGKGLGDCGGGDSGGFGRGEGLFGGVGDCRVFGDAPIRGYVRMSDNPSAEWHDDSLKVKECPPGGTERIFL